MGDTCGALQFNIKPGEGAGKGLFYGQIEIDKRDDDKYGRRGEDMLTKSKKIFGWLVIGSCWSDASATEEG